ncbi:hypothetical protein GGQ54_002573 [Naumannella cuiyingiana]|uniref:Uncharacterized protein n=1 Tax=Naumannella cuiyingiana TaxID=1347891 RepID=A0A7Z0DB25_9ACTN|nr:hypothetical protein [Naumannella cuiyingiana]NYI72013.1 hypothetical protein [Naumannella cuiyingiana]
MPLSDTQLVSTGILVLIVITIAFGGTFLLRVATGRHEANALQKSFFRAGHAHAGVLVILGMVIELFVTLGGVAAPWSWLSGGVLFSAILIPAGFFLSVLGQDPARPSRLIVLLWAGVASLVIGLVGAGVGLIAAGMG